MRRLLSQAPEPRYKVPGFSSGPFPTPDFPAFYFHAIRALPKAPVRSVTAAERHGSQWVLSTELENASKTPALMVRLKAVREKSGDRILPALYDDNYITL